tara:strand:+ start:1194 stop:2165 length:972 start_codon:yes stop_codon:yes gene_type:complete
MKNILVTGGAGYIGSHVVSELLNQGFHVIILDDMSSGSKKNIHSKANFILGSTLSHDDLSKVFQNEIDAVIHLAAFKAAGESMLNPSKYMNNNIIGSLNLIEACNKNNINKIVFSSTAAIYGKPHFLPVDENHSINPINYYGFTKLFVEKNLDWYSKITKLRYAALRYFNAAGYDSKHRIKGIEKNPQNLIPIIMEVAIGERNELEVYGNNYETIDGTGVRDYIHVTDLALAHITALKHLENNDKNLILNLGSGKGFSVLEIIKQIEKITNQKINYKIVKRRKGDLGTLISNSLLAEKILKWQPKNSTLSNIIKTTWEVYKKC